jgi:hypothetical protein
MLLAMSPAAAEEAEPWTPPASEDWDWLHLNSGEWLKAEISYMRDRTSRFDSDELDALDIDLADCQAVTVGFRELASSRARLAYESNGRRRGYPPAGRRPEFDATQGGRDMMWRGVESGIAVLSAALCVVLGSACAGMARGVADPDSTLGDRCEYFEALAPW